MLTFEEAVTLSILNDAGSIERSFAPLRMTTETIVCILLNPELPITASHQ